MSFVLLLVFVAQPHKAVNNSGIIIIYLFSIIDLHRLTFLQLEDYVVHRHNVALIINHI